MTRMTLIALSLAGWLAAAGAYGAEGSGVTQVQADWCATAPVIDGFEDEDEWAGATTVDLTVDLIPLPDLVSGQFTVSQSKTGRLYAMNDDDNLYLGVRLLDVVANEQFDPQAGQFKLDILAVQIDVDGDGLVSIGDDQKLLLTAPEGGIYRDQYRVKMQGPDEHTDDAAQDGAGQVRHLEGEGAGEYFFELAMPLDASDERDFVAAPGEELRIAMLFLQGFSPQAMNEAEIGVVLAPPLPEALAAGNLYGTLTLAAGP